MKYNDDLLDRMPVHHLVRWLEKHDLRVKYATEERTVAPDRPEWTIYFDVNKVDLVSTTDQVAQLLRIRGVMLKPRTLVAQYHPSDGTVSLCLLGVVDADMMRRYWHFYRAARVPNTSVTSFTRSLGGWLVGPTEFNHLHPDQVTH